VINEAKRREQQWPNIFRRTTGIMFLGTPFRGARGLNQEELLRAAKAKYEHDAGMVQGESVVLYQTIKY
jgi:hypothetical protein